MDKHTTRAKTLLNIVDIVQAYVTLDAWEANFDTPGF
jgi:hypothetical protein